MLTKISRNIHHTGGAESEKLSSSQALPDGKFLQLWKFLCGSVKNYTKQYNFLKVFKHFSGHHRKFLGPLKIFKTLEINWTLRKVSELYGLFWDPLQHFGSSGSFQKLWKFLDTLKLSGEILWTFWKVFKHSGKFLDTLKSFRSLWKASRPCGKVSGHSEKFPYTIKVFGQSGKVSRHSEKFLDNLENCWDTLENFRTLF